MTAMPDLSGSDVDLVVPIGFPSAMAPRRKTRRDTPLALLYARVSTAEQATDGASMPAQCSAMLGYAAQRTWNTETLTEAGASAKDMRGRPVLLAALERLDAGDADVLVVARLDRLTRSVADFAELVTRSARLGWRIAVLDLSLDTTTPAGELMGNVLVSFAQYERKVIGARTRDGMAQRRAEGVHIGRPPTITAELARRVVTAYAETGSYGATARALNTAGVPTIAGAREWYPSTVQRVLSGTTARRLATP